jgi:hypothetical protein
MALQFLYYAGQGPLQYEDTLTYSDMALMEASRAPQHYIENEPSQLYHVVRLSGLTSKLDSMGSAHGGSASTALSVANNAHSDASVADSKAVSAQAYASSADSSVLLIVSTTDSKVVSTDLYISTVNSKLESHMTP